MTTARRVDVRKAWLEAQTGVNYATLRRHYGEWMPSDDRSVSRPLRRVRS